MNTELAEIIRVMSQAHGRDISWYDESFLAQALEKRRAVTASQTAAAYLAYLAENSAEAAELCRSLHITYSEFFRDPLAFALLEHVILPRLVAEKSGRAEIRIWSAGCAAGQEPYSVALLLDDLARAREQPIPHRIFATDQSEAELAAARQGVYAAAAVQNVRLRHLHDYFTQQGETYTISARLRDRLDFSIHDLLDLRFASPRVSIYGDFDIVFCSNLLFYYQPDIRQFILDQVYHALSPHGYLVTGAAETAIVERASGFQAVNWPAAVLQKTKPRVR